MRRFECVEGSSSKFWEVERIGATLRIRFGRIGSAGSSQEKVFESDDKAQRELGKLAANKLKKGYVETGASGNVGAPAPAAEAAAEVPTKVRAPKGSIAASEKASRSGSANKARTFVAGVGSADAGQSGSMVNHDPAGAQSPAAEAAKVEVPREGPGADIAKFRVAGPPPVAEAVAPHEGHVADTTRVAQTHPAWAQVASEARAAAAHLAEDPSGVLWTDALRRRVHPRRGGVDAKVPPLPTIPKALAALRARWAERADAWQQALDQGRRGADVFARLGARIAIDPPPPADVDEDATLIATLAFRPVYRIDAAEDTAVDWLVATRGVAHAVVASLLALERSVARAEKPPVEEHHAPTLFDHATLVWNLSFAHGHLRMLPRLRQLLTLADDSAHAEALAAAESFRARATEPQRHAMAFLFPEATAWVEATLPNFLRYPSVLASVSSASQLAGVAIDALRLYTSTYNNIDRDLAATLLDGLGLAAAPFLLAQTTPYSDAEMRRDQYRTWAALGCDEAADALVGRFEDREAQAAFAYVVERQPRRALKALPARATARGKAAEPARTQLRALVRKRTDLVDALLPSLAEDAAREVRAIRDEFGVALPDAPLDAVPALLRSPPWTTRSKPATPPVVHGVKPPVPPARMQWAPGERDAASTIPPWVAHDPPTAAQAEAAVAHRKLITIRFLVNAPTVFARALAPLVQKEGYEQYAEAVVARHGLEAVPFILDRLQHGVDILRHCHAIGDVALALPMAQAFVHKKSLRALAKAWLLRFSDLAIAGLLGPALADPSETRSAAEAALRMLAAHGQREAILAAAESARAQTMAMLDFDPLLVFPAKLPKPDESLDPASLPRPALRSGGALPASTLPHLLAMLQFSTPERPYAGLDLVKAACEPTSLARFAWALFETWLTLGAPSKSSWCLQALGFFGDDVTARRLDKLIRAWPGEGSHARAVAGLDVLLGIGSDVALMLLNGIAAKAKFKGLQTKAQEKIAALAEARGLTPEELADRLAPDLGLDDDGTLRLDFGPRAFTVGFDEALRPFVKDASGTRLKDLPKPNKADDEAMAKEATARWSELKKDAKQAASIQILRLERAMCARRRFEAPAFVELFVSHPLVFHIVRRLLWMASDADGKPLGTFRVAEDRTFATVDDDAWTLPPDARVSCVHPLEVAPPDLLSRWSQVFADYELAQPFAQLGRPTFAPTAAERSETQLLRARGLKVPTGKVLGLEARGWRRGPVRDSGVIGWMEKALGHGDVATLALDPGLYTGNLGESPEQTLGAVVIGKGGPASDGPERRRRLGELDPIEFSELVADLEGLR
jgi:predicted DNA-binding WGR domain protein